MILIPNSNSNFNPKKISNLKPQLRPHSKLIFKLIQIPNYSNLKPEAQTQTSNSNENSNSPPN